uniref:Uncharacterized protein n=1 Tax=Rhizophora mucronata TaxID=61149 RepID=A0A2P2NFS2_RHIMU
MDWCNSGYDRIVTFNAESKTPRWRLLWRRIMREKKKLFHCFSVTATTSRVHFSYDPYDYSQNFDQESMWCDPDNISRSFSARFAVSSRIFNKSELVGC